MIFVRDIQQAVAREHGIDPAIMRWPYRHSGARLRDHAWPRQEAMALSLLLTDHSKVRIGHFFGGRDHSTVIEARKRVSQRATENAETRERLARIAMELLETVNG